MTPADDQEAAARREEGRQAAVSGGRPASLRRLTISVTEQEAEALARGETPGRIRELVDRQLAEDAAVKALEEML